MLTDSGQVTVTRTEVDPVLGTTGAFLTVTVTTGSGSGGGGAGTITSVNGDAGPTVVLTAAEVGADVAGAAAAAQAASQPLDSDLTAIAALSTTSYGRAFLALADAAAGRTALGLGTAATQASTAFDAAGAAAAAQSASQPLDSDLTAIAALATTSFGRSVLALADAAALRTLAGLGTAATVNTGTASGTIPLLGTGGVLPLTELGTGTPAAGKYVDGAGAWTTLPSGGSSIPSPDDIPGSPDAFDYEFNVDNTASLPSGWAWTNQSTSVYLERYGKGSITGVADSQWHLLDRAVPAGSTWTVVGKFNANTRAAVTLEGITMRDSTSGKLITYVMYGNNNVEWAKWSSPSAFSSEQGQGATSVTPFQFYLRIKKNSSSSFDMAISQDAVTWLTTVSALDISAFLTTFDRIGFGIYTESGLVPSISCHWMRKTA